jgi:xylose isomerase
MRFGAGIWLFGQFVDRYATDAYGPSVSTLEAIERAGAVGDLDVLDINYPISDPDIGVDDVKRALDTAGLAADTITPHIYTREFVAGAFTNPDPAVRRRALALCEEAVDVARRLGAPKVKLWPGQDGFDYPFQADYRELWKLAVDGVRTVAEMDDDIRVSIEYKAKEPRTHLSWSTAARTLVGIQQIGRDDVGIVVDLGHSLFA